MSAPRFFSRLSFVLLAALVAAGCTVPGSSRLQGPPDDLPPSLDLVTADVLGYTLYDTDPGSARWADMPARTADEALATLHSGLTGGFPAELDDVAPWIGDAAGSALRELDLDGATETSTLYFADVRDRAALESFLDDAGWSSERSNDLGGPGDDAALWTHDAACDDTPAGSRAVCAAPEHVAYTAAAVTDDAIVAARSTAALRELLRSADEYAVPERTAMSEFTVEAAERVPVAFVFRADLLRTQVRRPFEHDPALLEFARWATDSNVLVALRDGWIGLAPAVDPERRQDAVRIVGAAEWVPDLAPDITLGPSTPDLMSELGPNIDLAVALHDPGQHLRELVRAVTLGAGQYVTEQDVPDDQPGRELQPVLDRLDGNAAIGVGHGELRAAFEDTDGGGTTAAVEAALRHAGVPATTDASDGIGHVTVDLPATPSTSGRRPSPAPPEAPTLDQDDFSAAGTPPRQPVAWLWARGRGCIGESAGWITFDGTERMTLGLDVELHGVRTDADPGSPLASCIGSLLG